LRRLRSDRRNVARRGRSGVLKVRVVGDRAETRVVVELDQGAKAKLVGGDGQRSVVLAWPELDAARSRAERARASSPLGGRRGRRRGAAEAEPHEDAEVARRFLLPPGDGVEAYRYVVDLRPRTKIAAVRTSAVKSDGESGCRSRARQSGP
jgi:N-acetylmuramoyl-L-alanine amidase